jgi:hypothetical protein
MVFGAINIKNKAEIKGVTGRGCNNDAPLLLVNFGGTGFALGQTAYVQGGAGEFGKHCNLATKLEDPSKAVDLIA